MAKIEKLFQILQQQGGSDLHMSPGNPPLIRVSGHLKPAISQAFNHEQCRGLIYEIMNEAQRKEFEDRQDLDFAYESTVVNARFRANIFMGRLGLSAVFRLIPTDILTVEQLGLPQAVLDFTDFKKGLVLVTGPTGSGKSTTLAAMIDHINRHRNEHILTVEDPIEFVHKGQKSLINQREVGVHTQTFASALKAALREDPDIILVGEMRDLETIELAITAAETGHLVFGTLHTSSAAKTVDRLVNVFPTTQQEQIRTMLAESLRGVVAQQLLRTVDSKRCAALEILKVNAAAANLIREGKTFQIPSIIQTGSRDGMQLMDQALQKLLVAKKVTLEEASRFAVNKNQFQTLNEGTGGGNEQ